MFRYIKKVKPRMFLGVIILLFFVSSNFLLDTPAKYARAISLLNDRSADIIGAAALNTGGWSNLKLSGEGQIIGIADSGLDKGSISDIHPDLATVKGKMPKVAMLKSYSGRKTADDPSGHGTHMAATIAGNGASSDGKYQGIAPGASLYFQALLNEDGQLTIPQSIDTLFRPAYEAEVKVHVDGWGTGSNMYGNRSAQIDAFVYKHPDFLPVFGAGNGGPTEGSLTMEANSKNALIIGSSQVSRPAFSPEASQTDRIADSSSRGPAADGRIKPDLLAPGSLIISACSSLVKSNFEANPLYTRMGGTSMASAVTGGSIALLRQYLTSYSKLNQPSAALVKALLINGSRLNSDNQPGQGFGILDLYGTILGLKEGMFKITDSAELAADETEEYSLRVTDTAKPVRVTLAWSDPAAPAGSTRALVNDLDLQIKAPDGTIYNGNAFLNNNGTDHINNVELIYIPEPERGEYKISIKASGMNPQYPTQSYALVYGQNLTASVITDIEGNQLHLLDGNILNSDNSKIITLGSNSEILIGSQIYQGTKASYIFARHWENGGIKPLTTPKGELLVEMNTQKREGGFYIDPRWLTDREGKVQFNHKNVDIANLPDGIKVEATLNPVRQTLWDIKTRGQKISGYISRIDAEKNTLYLLDELEAYKITDRTALSYHSHDMLDSSVEALPFGYVENTCLSDLLPGFKVELLIDPQTREVLYINAEKQMVVAQISSIDTEKGTIRAATGKTYRLFPGVEIYRDYSQVKLQELKPGDWLVGMLLDEDDDELLDVQVLSSLSWGRVIFASNKLNTLYILDQKNQFQRYDLSGDVMIYRGGTAIDKASLVSGDWVRVLTKPDTNIALRVDVAEIAEECRRVFSAYYPEKGIMRLADGTSYTCPESTLFVRSGCNISPLDILPGETVKITALEVPSPAENYVARVEVDKSPAAVVPSLQFNAYGLNGALIVQGSTSAQRISVYRQDGSRHTIKVRDDGSFSQVFSLLEGEENLRVIALDTATGGVTIQASVVIAYPVQEKIAEFPDVIYHSARPEIEALKSAEIVHGYEDGYFRPDQAITRLEFFTMLTNAFGEKTAPLKNIEKFSDYSFIPWWGLNVVNTAREEGWIAGYPDGSFRPNQHLTQTQLNVILKQLQLPEENNIVINSDNSDYLITRAEAAQVVFKLYRLEED